MNTPTLLLAGAGSEIGRAIAAKLQEDGQWQLITIGRNPSESARHMSVDLTAPSSVDRVSCWMQDNHYQPDAVIACMGVLHDTPDMPEKTLSQIRMDWLLTNIQVNLISHLHLAQAMHSQIGRSRAVRWMSLSAKVGSITDNQLGGWHSYRISKAALNMLIRNLSIEWQRKNPKNTVVAVHPGTTDSALSKPFQARLTPDKLFTPECTAERMLNILHTLTPAQSGSLLHWDGSALPW